MKRRLLCIVCILILLCCSVFSAMAESFDLSALTDPEIVTLLEMVNREVVTRGIQKTATLPKGTYIAGRDLPAGSYVFTSLVTGNDWGSLTVYSDEGAGDQLLWEILTAPQEGQEPETIYIKLNEGDRLKSGVPFSLTITGGVLFR